MSQNKSLVYGKILVDDFPEYVEPWLKNRPRGLAIIPAHPWNKEFKHDRAIRYDRSNLDQVRKAMEIAKQRQSKGILDLSNL